MIVISSYSDVVSCIAHLTGNVSYPYQTDLTCILNETDTDMSRLIRKRFF